MGSIPGAKKNEFQGLTCLGAGKIYTQVFPLKIGIWHPKGKYILFQPSFFRGYILGGGFKYVLFSSLFGEDSHFDQYFSNGLKPPTSIEFRGCNIFVCCF